MSKTYRFTESYQSLIVSAILQDPTLLVESRDALRAEYFNKFSEQEIVRILLEFYDQYRQRPLRDTMVQLVYNKAAKIGWQDDDRDKLVTELYRIYMTPLQEADCQLIKSNVTQFGRIQALKIAMLESINTVDSYERGEDVDLGTVESRIQKALIVGAEKNLGLDLYQSMQDMRKVCTASELSSVDRRVQTGYPTMDRFLKGGLGGGEFGLILAPSNKGKSMVLVNLACAGFRQGKKVLYFSFEMKEPEITSRMAANLTRVDIDKVQVNDPEYTIKFAEIQNMISARNLRTIYIKPSEATTNNLRSVIMNIQTMEGWLPELILVDYIDEMATSGSKGRDDETYQRYGQLASDLLSLSVDYQCPLWTASQVNREGYNGEPAMADTGRSMQKIDKAEFVFALVQSETQAKDFKMTFKILKNRRGPGVGYKIKCHSVLSRAEISEEVVS